MIRYAIWAAVSSERQAAEDKISLEHQQVTCRIRAALKGWYEAAGPYIVPGESRTPYINLSDAEAAIPQLREMLDAAQRGQYDVLMLYDFTRLRELIDPVARTLAAYGVQLYSLAQSVEPIDPAQFDRRLTGTSSIVQAVSAITSRAEIDNLTRRLRSGIDGRFAKGLRPSGYVPYGYKNAPSADYKKLPAVIDPPKATVVVKIKDLYLAGQTAHQIIDYLARNHIPSPRGGKWAPSNIYYILKNPFYAGDVRAGYMRNTYDPRKGKKGHGRGDPSQVRYVEGQHEPLWDHQTVAAIEAELKLRSRKNKGKKTYRLSNLLRCPEHDRGFYVYYVRNQREDQYRGWFCPVSNGEWHNHITDDRALALLQEKLTTDLQNTSSPLRSGPVGDKTDLQNTAVKDLQTRRARLTDALEGGNMDPATYAERVKAIDSRLREIQKQIKDAAAAVLQRSARDNAISSLAQAIADAPEFIRQAPAQLVNQHLRNIIEHIHVLPNGEIEIIYR